jgi:hypothetical protein
MMNLPEDGELTPWMAPLLKMTAEHLTTALDGEARPDGTFFWPWINRLTGRETARLLIRILTARESLDLKLATTDRMLTWLGVLWNYLRIGEQAIWEPLVMEARNRGLATRGNLPPAETSAVPPEEPTT